MKIVFNEATPEQWAALKERIATKKKLTDKQAMAIKIKGSKTKNQPAGVCWHCGKPLTKADEEAGRRRICVECY